MPLLQPAVPFSQLDGNMVTWFGGLGFFSVTVAAEFGARMPVEESDAHGEKIYLVPLLSGPWDYF